MLNLPFNRPSIRPTAMLAALTGAAFALTGCNSATRAQAIPDAGPKHVVEAPHQPIETELAMATFDTAWQLVHDTHFDPKFNGVDWNAVRNELRPQVAALDDEDALRHVINDMLGRLGQSHFALLPRDVVDSLNADDDPPSTPDDPDAVDSVDSVDTDQAIRTGDVTSAGESNDSDDSESDDDENDRQGYVGIKLCIIDNEAVITHVEAQGPARSAGIESGWVIEEIDGRALDSTFFAGIAEHVDEKLVNYHAHQFIDARLLGAPGSTVALSLRDDRDKAIELELERVQRPGDVIQFGNLPPINALLEHEHLAADDGVSVGVIRFNIWMIPLVVPFARAMDDLRSSDGIIIDLRGNPGGVAGMAMGVAGHFFNDEGSLGVMKTRSGELNFVIMPRRIDTNYQPIDPFSGPVAILIDQSTASTSEIFAAGMQSVGRARVFGETSIGAALPAMMDRLPNGDVLLHAFADFILPTGQSIEGTGVIPDEPITLTRKDLLGGHDPVLTAAMKWIAAEKCATPVALLLED